MRAETTTSIKNKKGRKSVVLNSEAWLEFCKEREILKTKSDEQVQDYGDSDSDEEEADRKNRNEGRKSIVMDAKAWEEHAKKIKKMLDDAEKKNEVFDGGDSNGSSGDFQKRQVVTMDSSKSQTNSSTLQSDAKVENFGEDSDEDEDD
mmetsp:Transcript_6023/g.7361  ORF Transcript_6023/g.7361 Transcript_6023/m.7361 type:complete len:148 (-) Transcript_6023:237-680(-)